jgi:hypothetical protein
VIVAACVKYAGTRTAANTIAQVLRKRVTFSFDLDC